MKSQARKSDDEADISVPKAKKAKPSILKVNPQSDEERKRVKAQRWEFGKDSVSPSELVLPNRTRAGRRVSFGENTVKEF